MMLIIIILIGTVQLGWFMRSLLVSSEEEKEKGHSKDWKCNSDAAFMKAMQMGCRIYLPMEFTGELLQN